MTLSQKAVEAALSAYVQHPVKAKGDAMDAMKSALSAALAVDGLCLVWSEPYEPNNYCCYNHCFADTPFGRYQIEWKGWKDRPGYFAQGPGDLAIPCDDNLDDVKREVEEHIMNGIRKLLAAASDGEERKE